MNIIKIFLNIFKKKEIKPHKCLWCGNLIFKDYSLCSKECFNRYKNYLYKFNKKPSQTKVALNQRKYNLKSYRRLKKCKHHKKV